MGVSTVAQTVNFEVEGAALRGMFALLELMELACRLSVEFTIDLLFLANFWCCWNFWPGPSICCVCNGPSDVVELKLLTGFSQPTFVR